MSVESEDFQLKSVLAEIPGIYADLPYASKDNFFGEALYDFTEPLLRAGTIRKLKRAQEILKNKGYSLLVWDGYRPYRAQCRMWDIFPREGFVSNPKTGYLGHPRGNAIDVTLTKEDGTPLEMPSGFDDFSDRAKRDYSSATQAAREHALCLEQAMSEAGFRPYYGEWWHFTDTDEYPVVYD